MPTFLCWNSFRGGAVAPPRRRTPRAAHQHTGLRSLQRSNLPWACVPVCNRPRSAELIRIFCISWNSAHGVNNRKSYPFGRSQYTNKYHTCSLGSQLQCIEFRSSTCREDDDASCMEICRLRGHAGSGFSRRHGRGDEEK